jgi:hypothetical protein
MKLGVLFSLLTGCAQKPIIPTAPGVSVKLAYPVLLAGEHRTLVKDDEESLTSTTAASGLNFLVATLIDSSGARYSIPRVTDFGRKSSFLDMGTTPYRVFLELKPEGKVDLAQAKQVVLAEEPEAALDGVGSLAALIEACR